MESKTHSQLILAIMQGEDYDETVKDLNQNGFFVTMLNTTGGFLRKRSVTAMIGVDEGRLEEVLEILKRCAGRRRTTIYQNTTIPHGGSMPVIQTYPTEMDLGGVTVFIMDVHRMEKF